MTATPATRPWAEHIVGELVRCASQPAVDLGLAEQRIVRQFDQAPDISWDDEIAAEGDSAALCTGCGTTKRWQNGTAFHEPGCAALVLPCSRPSPVPAGDAEPRPDAFPDQRSLLDQVTDLWMHARAHKMYDAQDWIATHWRGADLAPAPAVSAGTCEHTRAVPNHQGIRTCPDCFQRVARPVSAGDQDSSKPCPTCRGVGFIGLRTCITCGSSGRAGGATPAIDGGARP